MSQASLNSYAERFRKTKIVSQIGLAIIVLVVLRNVIGMYEFGSHDDNWGWKYDLFIYALLFNIGILIISLARYVLLMFWSKRNFVISQACWAATVASICIFGICSAGSFVKFLTGQKPEFSHSTLFIFADPLFDGVVYSYFFVSLIRQLATLLFIPENKLK